MSAILSRVGAAAAVLLALSVSAWANITGSYFAYGRNTDGRA